MPEESELVSQITIDDLFEGMNDFDLSDCISGAIEERYGYDNLMDWPSSIPLEHRVAHYVWSTTGFLECEGYARFFSLHCNHAAYPQCFDSLGLPDLAEAVRGSLRTAPQGLLGDTDALIALFGTWEKLEASVDDTESLLYSKSEAIQAAHAAYVRRHKASFERLLPEMKLQRAFEEYVSAQSGPNTQQGEQGSAGQPATRSESDSESDDKPQPESEGRSR